MLVCGKRCERDTRISARRSGEVPRKQVVDAVIGMPEATGARINGTWAGSVARICSTVPSRSTLSERGMDGDQPVAGNDAGQQDDCGLYHRS